MHTDAKKAGINTPTGSAQKKEPQNEMKSLITFKEFTKSLLESREPVPPVLYHATFRPLLKKIREFGLDSSRGRPLWDDSVAGYVYLSDDKDYAASFAESTEADIPDSWFDKIIVLTIDTDKLDRDLLFIDSNNLAEEPTYEYRGVIPFSAVTKIENYD